MDLSLLDDDSCIKSFMCLTVYIISGTPVNVKIHRSLSANKRFLNIFKTGTQQPMTYHPLKFIFRKRVKLRRKNGII